MYRFPCLFRLIFVILIGIKCCFAVTCTNPPVEENVNVMFGIHVKELIIDKDDKGFFLIVKNPFPNALWIVSNPTTQTSSMPTSYFFDKWVEYGDSFSLDQPHVVVVNECLIDKNCKAPPSTFSLYHPTKLCEDTWRFEIPNPPGYLKPNVIEDGVMVIYLMKKYSDTRHLPFLELVY